MHPTNRFPSRFPENCLYIGNSNPKLEVVVSKYVAGLLVGWFVGWLVGWLVIDPAVRGL
jgi:hypothetical protein